MFGLASREPFEVALDAGDDAGVVCDFGVPVVMPRSLLRWPDELPINSPVRRATTAVR